MGYTRTADGVTYQFSQDDHTDASYTEAGSPDVVEDEFRTVAYRDLERGTAVAHGIGNSRNPDRAEGFAYVDAQSTAPANIDGQARFVVLNSQREKVATIWRGSLKQLRSGSTAPADRDKRKPLPYQDVRNGNGEVAHPYEIGFQIKAASSSAGDTFSLSDSEILIEGYLGEAIN